MTGQGKRGRAGDRNGVTRRSLRCRMLKPATVKLFLSTDVVRTKEDLQAWEVSAARIIVLKVLLHKLVNKLCTAFDDYVAAPLE